MIFFKNAVSPSDENIIYFEAFEGENSVGTCTLVLEDKFAHVIELTFSAEAPYIAEGLLKSAYNYACLKNYYMGKCTVKDIDFLLKKMGFINNDGVYQNDIPSILMGSCSSCNK